MGLDVERRDGGLARETSDDDTRARRDVIVVGGSAGAIEVLEVMLAALPADLDAAVLVVVHVSPGSPGQLAEILQRHCALEIAWATDDEPLETGRIYLAPPERHLVVGRARARVRLTRAPRENHSRPAIDPLFRSAALAFGPRVVGVVLSGRLDDGTAGLCVVKACGGVAVVQDPDDAAHPDMPSNALEFTRADHVVAAAELGPLLARLMKEPATATDATAPRELEVKVRIALNADGAESGAPPGADAPDPSFVDKARAAQERAATIRESVLRHRALSRESLRASARELEREAEPHTRGMNRRDDGPPGDDPPISASPPSSSSVSETES